MRVDGDLHWRLSVFLSNVITDACTDAVAVWSKIARLLERWRSEALSLGFSSGPGSSFSTRSTDLPCAASSEQALFRRANEKLLRGRRSGRNVCVASDFGAAA